MNYNVAIIMGGRDDEAAAGKGETTGRWSVHHPSEIRAAQACEAFCEPDLRETIDMKRNKGGAGPPS